MTDFGLLSGQRRASVGNDHKYTTCCNKLPTTSGKIAQGTFSKAVMARVWHFQARLPPLCVQFSTPVAKSTSLPLSGLTSLFTYFSLFYSPILPSF
jgi:hypothetical protein